MSLECVCEVYSSKYPTGNFYSILKWSNVGLCKNVCFPLNANELLLLPHFSDERGPLYKQYHVIHKHTIANMKRLH